LLLDRSRPVKRCFQAIEEITDRLTGDRMSERPATQPLAQRAGMLPGGNHVAEHPGGLFKEDTKAFVLSILVRGNRAEEGAPLLGREPRRVHGPALYPRLREHHRDSGSALKSIAGNQIPGYRGGAQGQLTDQRSTAGNDLASKALILWRVDAVQPTTQDGDGWGTLSHGGPMRDRIDSASEPANDPPPPLGQRSGDGSSGGLAKA
jgi:hypothetical protein